MEQYVGSFGVAAKGKADRSADRWADQTTGRDQPRPHGGCASAVLGYARAVGEHHQVAKLAPSHDGGQPVSKLVDEGGEQHHRVHEEPAPRHYVQGQGQHDAADERVWH